jgi:WD40 repeat protein
MTDVTQVVLWERVTVFVSSTFSDMHAERDYLMKRVFPNLHDWCDRRRLRLVDVDLRWGVTETDATRNKNVVQTCLSQIDYCRPFFICLAGQRRGWVPMPEDVPAETLAAFPDLLPYVGKASVTEMEFLHAVLQPLHGAAPRDETQSDEYYNPAEYAYFYLRDPSYVAQLPADPKLLRQTYTNEWVADPTERAEQDAGLSQWRDVQIPATGRSARAYTAEWRGDLATPELALPLGCPSAVEENRDRWRKRWADVGVALDADGLHVADTDAAQAFNERLTQGRLAEFGHEGRDLSEIILEDLKRGIEERFPDHVERESEPGSLQHELDQQEQDQQEQFLFVNSEGFIRRGDDFAELDAYVQGKSRKMFVLTAEGGMGKSMLLANWLDHCRTHRNEYPGTTFHFRFVGQSDGSTTVAGVQRSLLTELQGLYGKIPETVEVKGKEGAEPTTEPVEIPTDPGKLASFWREWLPKLKRIGQNLQPQHESTHETRWWGRLMARWRRCLHRDAGRTAIYMGRTVIVIDALNQLETGLTRLDWLPQTGLPDGVKIIVSFRRGAEGSEELLKKWGEPYFQEKIQLAEVQPFDDYDDRRKLVKAYLRQYLKELDAHLIKDLIGVEGAGNPLFLKVVLSELRVFGSFEQLAEKIKNDFGSDPVNAFRAVLRRLASDPAYGELPSEDVVPAVFAALACSRGGLTTTELADILCRARDSDEPTLEEQAAARESVLIVLRQERPFLARRAGRHDVFYESFVTAARDAYCTAASPEPGARDATEWHGLIADHYASEPNTNKRRLSELPWHLIEAERQAEAGQLLADFAFLQAKVDAFGPQPLIEDYDLLELDRQEPLGLIQGAIMLGAHVLSCDSAQLRFQLLGRLLGADAAEIRRLLGDAEPTDGECCLRPLHPCLTPPGGPLLRTLAGHTGSVVAVSLHTDGRRAVSASDDQTLKMWDLDTGACLRTLEGHTSGVGAVSLHADGRRAVSASWDSTLKVWDLDSGACLRTLEGHTGNVISVALHADGHRAVSASYDNTLKVWDLETGACLRTFEGHTVSVVAVSLHADGRRAVSASWDCTLKVWDLETGTCLRTLEGHAWHVKAVSLHADGRRAVSASYDNTLKVWDLNSGACLRTLEGHTGSVVAVSLHTNGCRAVSASEDGTLKVWDLETGALLRTLEGHTGSVVAVSLHTDGRRAVSASHDKTLKVWDLETGACLRTLKGHTRSVTAVSLHTDGRRAVSASWDGTLNVWDLKTGACLRTLKGHTGWVRAVSLHANDRRAVSASNDQTLKVWDLDTGALLRTLEGHTDTVRAVSLHADGLRAVSTSWDHTLKVWDLNSGACLRTLEGHTGSVVAVSLHTNGRRAVSASEDGTLKVWDLETGDCLRTLAGHTGSINSVALYADGRRAVSASHDKTLKVWDLEIGQELASFTAEASVECCTLALNGDTVVAGDQSGHMYFLRLEDGNGKV